MDFDNSFDTITPDIQPAIAFGGTAGLIFPSGTTAQRNSSVNGTIRFNTDGAMPETYVSSLYLYLKLTPSLATTGIVAAGTAYNTATALISDYNLVSTVSVSANGVSLPSPSIIQLYGRRIHIYNDSADLLYVYPQSGGSIDGQSANVSTTLAAGKTLVIMQLDATRWATVSNSGATGGGGGAPTGSSYITLAGDSTLTGERVLQGTTKQITITDGGANGNVVLSIPAWARIPNAVTVDYNGYSMEMNQGFYSTGEGRITTTGPALTMRQTSGTYGASSFIVKNDARISGAQLYQESATNLVDLAFRTAGVSTIASQRVEWRSAYTTYAGNYASGEFQLKHNVTNSPVISLVAGVDTVGILSPYAVVAGNLTIGTTASNTTTINSTITANGSVGSAGQVLTSRGSGLSPQWTSVSGGGGSLTANVLSLSIDGSVPNGRTFVVDQAALSTYDEGINKQFNITSTGLFDEWTSVEVGATEIISSMAYDPTTHRIVAVGGYTTGAITSTNGGVSWVPCGLDSAYAWSSIVYGESKFVAVSSTASGTLTSIKAAYSSTGTSWTYSNLPVSQNWSDVAYANSNWVAMDNTYGADVISYSVNGTGWTSIDISSLVAGGVKTSLVAANNTFIIPVSSWPTPLVTILRSPTGGSWSDYPQSGEMVNATHICASGDGSRFVAITSNRSVFTSTDGITWTLIPSNLAAEAAAGPDPYEKVVSYYDTTTGTVYYLIHVSASVNPIAAQAVVYVSTNLSTWITCNDKSTASNWQTAVYDGNTSSALIGGLYERGFGGGALAVKSGGAGSFAVTGKKVPPRSYTKITGSLDGYIAYFAGNADDANIGVCVFTSAAAYMDPTVGGVTVPLPWGYTWTDIAFDGNSTYVAIPSGSNGLATISSLPGELYNGFAVMPTYGPATAAWTSITFGNGVFVAVANDVSSNTMAIPTSTYVPSYVTNATVGYAKKVIYGGGVFIMIPTSGNKISTSVDGTTWIARTLPGSITFGDVAYGNGTCVVVPYGSTTYYYTHDFTTWVSGTLPALPASITFGGGRFYVATSGAVGNISVDGIVWKAAPATSYVSALIEFSSDRTGLTVIDDVAFMSTGAGQITVSFSSLTKCRDTITPTTGTAPTTAANIRSNASDVGLSLVSTGAGAVWAEASRIKKFPIIIDFGSTPVTSKSIVVDVTPIASIMSHSPLVMHAPGTAIVGSILTGGTGQGVLGGDEAEMDAFICSASFNQVTSKLTVYATAIPGPVIGKRSFVVIL